MNLSRLRGRVNKKRAYGDRAGGFVYNGCVMLKKLPAGVRKLVGIYLLVLLVVGSFAGGVWFARAEKFGGPGFARVKDRKIVIEGVGSKAPERVRVQDFGLYWDLWNNIKDKFYKQPVDEGDLFYSSLEGMTAGLKDPYSVFLRPKNAEEFSKDLAGEFTGIGAEIGIKHDQLVVVTPLPGSPAERAGLRARDAIIAINGESTIGMPVDVAVTKIRGPKGTEVTLMIKTGDGEPREVKIIRAVIVVKSVTWKTVRTPGGKALGHIMISQFNADTRGLMDQAIRDVLGDRPAGIILDMRNNPGGFFDAAVSVAGEWITENTVAVQKFKGGNTQEFRSNGRARLAVLKTVVLVNEGSASATEIVAGALQDYGVATVVGEKTFGKGLVQDLVGFPDGSALKITVAEWTTPKGRFINEQGIQPDVLITFTDEDYNADRDPQLDEALRLFDAPQAP